MEVKPVTKSHDFEKSTIARGKEEVNCCCYFTKLSYKLRELSRLAYSTTSDCEAELQLKKGLFYKLILISGSKDGLPRRTEIVICLMSPCTEID